MNTYLFFDTETTGFFDYGTPCDIDTVDLFPRIVQLAWQLYNENGELMNEDSNIIAPQNFVIPDDAIAVHGISTQQAIEKGRRAGFVLDEFLDEINFATYIVAHNYDYDAPVCGAEFYRYFSENPLESKPAFCTQKQTTHWAKIPGISGRYKWPSLAELHRACGFGEIVDAHDAMVDVRATAKCFFHIKNNDECIFDEPYYKPHT